MAFNFGAFGGGLSSGLDSGISNRYNLTREQYLQQQLDMLAAQNMGQSAYANSLFPGASPMPQQSGGMRNIPLIGPLGSALGLWDNPQATQVAAAQQPTQGGGGLPLQPMPAQQPAQMPPQGVAPGQGSGVPMPQPNPAFHAGQGFETSGGGTPSQGGEITPQQAAQTIDRANPGLRQRNPLAFSMAVQTLLEHTQQQAQTSLGREETKAKIADIRAQTGERAGHEAYYRGRAQSQNYIDKRITDEIKGNDRAITELEKEKTNLAKAPFGEIPSAKQERLARVRELNGLLQGYRARGKILEDQLSGKTASTQTKTSAVEGAAGAPKTPEDLYSSLKISDTTLKRFRSMSKDKQTAAISNLRSKGVSEEQINDFINLLELVK